MYHIRLFTPSHLQHSGAPWTQMTMLITNFSVFEFQGLWIWLSTQYTMAPPDVFLQYFGPHRSLLPCIIFGIYHILHKNTTAFLISVSLVQGSFPHTLF